MGSNGEWAIRGGALLLAAIRENFKGLWASVLLNSKGRQSWKKMSLLKSLGNG